MYKFLLGGPTVVPCGGPPLTIAGLGEKPMIPTYPVPSYLKAVSQAKNCPVVSSFSSLCANLENGVFLEELASGPCHGLPSPSLPTQCLTLQRTQTMTTRSFYSHSS